MDMPFLRGIEDFLNSAPGILIFQLLAILTALAAFSVVAQKKPRWEWKRAFAAAAWIASAGLAGLFGELLMLGWNQGTLRSVAADLARGLEFSVALAVCWFVLFPRRSSSGDLAAAVLAILALLGAAISAGSFFFLGGGGYFNANIISLLWDSARFLLMLSAIFLLIIRRPSAWGLSLVILSLLFAGVLFQMGLSSGESDLPGLARMWEILAFPLIAMRLSLTVVSGTAMAGAGTPFRLARQAAAESVPELADLMLVEETDLPPALAAWAATVMKADTCFLVSSDQEKNSLNFMAGVDRVQTRALPAFSCASEEASQLYFSVVGHEVLRMGNPAAAEAFQPVAAAAGLPQAGPALFIPLSTAGEDPMGILLLSVYSSEEWTGEDEEALRQFAQAGTAAFRRVHTIKALHKELDTSALEAARSAADLESIQKERLNLETRLEQAEQEWKKERQRAEGLAALVNEQDTRVREAGGSSDRLQELEERLANAGAHEEETVGRFKLELEKTLADLDAARRDAARLPEAISAATAFREESLRLQEELRKLQEQAGAQPSQVPGAEQEEIVHLRTKLEEADARSRQEISRLQNELRRTLTEYTHLQSALLQPPQETSKGPGLETGAETGMVSSIISEIRQPLSSMVGYADLLLSESAGILGAMQRKFLERIRASITRTEALFEDLLQLILLPGKISAPRIQPVDVAALIDGAVSGVSETVREKNLVLRLDLDEEMPPVELDRDALQQIINHLVQNAVLATAPEKEVFLTAHAPLSDREGQRALLITIKDSGQGIAAEDQPRVFTRLYRAEGPLIEGLGDTGVGMAVARTLTDAMGGRIWLESQIGGGTTFFVLLPVRAGTRLGE